jgi:hypothetical protein
MTVAGQELGDQRADLPVVIDHEDMRLPVHGRYYLPDRAKT